METNLYSLAQLQDLLKIEEENYRRAIEDMHDFEEAKKIYLKIKEIKNAIDMFERNN